MATLELSCPQTAQSQTQRVGDKSTGEARLMVQCNEVIMESGKQCRVKNEPSAKKKRKKSRHRPFLSLPCLVMNKIKEGQSEATGSV